MFQKLEAIGKRQDFTPDKVDFNNSVTRYINKSLIEEVSELKQGKKKYFVVYLTNGDVLFTKPFKLND